MTFLVDDAYNPSVMNTRLRWISFVCGLTVGTVFVGAETKSQNAPTPPPGYKTRLEILAAFGNGKLEMVERDVPLPDGVVLEKDIEYGNADGHSLQLDLYRPAKTTKPVPALLFIHGGAWKSGKRQDYHFYTAAYAKRGTWWRLPLTGLWARRRSRRRCRTASVPSAGSGPTQKNTTSTQAKSQ